ncbi:hypothetical protein E4582_02690 [Luteimonas yindakuii]|uniref:Uncharacterized protein n=1 Tax=Luteimonas yindakuii TaxID=2565782 RepID=A0A4Z1R4D9_9GAMM|nr:hypothetical protein [Luteimonas yindakuii]TKS53786.1 hypothetical protein E4582_02690 [Luteimonas yindakuii]
MSNGRSGEAGATRVCPHCKTTILQSATICPSCRHYLRFDAPASVAGASTNALQVEGTIRHPAEGGAWEYSVVLVVRDEEGKELNRQVVGVGALFGGDERSFSLTVEITPTHDTRRPGKRGLRH